MSIIKILPSEIAGRIAAGEVIERPASVVKELVENSIDAGARRIKINIEQGGQKLIQVMDDGCGMDREDAMMCLEAHATSKITENGDVGQIRTLGFRGEALPSISSVSRFQLQTRHKGELTGTEVLVNNGTIENMGDCGCSEGTNIKVGYLFGNLPARRKFMKGPQAEEAYIEEIVLLLSLSRPDISFELTMNKRTALRLPPADNISVRSAMLMGKEAFSEMLTVDYAEDDIHIYGFISKPGFTRSNRREQRIIINGRAASAETVFFAIRNAYDTLIVKGRYPSAILYIDLPPDRVDVNVHPAKREVRFREPLKISAILGAALRGSLRSMSSGFDEPIAIPASTVSKEMPLFSGNAPNASSNETQRCPNSLEIKNYPTGTAPAETSRPAPEEKASAFPARKQEESDFLASPPLESRNKEAKATTGSIQPPVIAVPDFSPIQPELDIQAPPSLNLALSRGKQETCSGSSPLFPSSSFPGKDEQRASSLHIRVLSPLGKNYLLAESSTGLVVINIKAAHRRIIFERILKNLNQQTVIQQQLLLPVTLNLSPHDGKFLEGRLSSFRQLGFTIEPFGGHTFLVSAVPSYVKDMEISGMLQDIISDLRDDSSTDRQSMNCLARIASRHISPGNHELMPEERQQLLLQLLECEMPYACPSGLPTMLHITYSELERRFGK